MFDLLAEEKLFFWMKLLPGLCFFCELEFLLPDPCRNWCILPAERLFCSYSRSDKVDLGRLFSAII